MNVCYLGTEHRQFINQRRHECLLFGHGPQTVYKPTKAWMFVIWARTTDSFPIGDHYNVLTPTLKSYPAIFFKLSQYMTDPPRHLVCEIRENDILPFRTNCFNAWHPCISAMKFPGFQNMSVSCLMATVSLRNRYTDWQMASFQSSDATACTKTSLPLTHSHNSCSHEYTQTALFSYRLFM